MLSLFAPAALIDLPAHILTAVFIGLVCIALFSIAGFCSMLVNIWAQTRRRPSPDETF